MAFHLFIWFKAANEHVSQFSLLSFWILDFGIAKMSQQKELGSYYINKIVAFVSS